MTIRTQTSPNTIGQPVVNFDQDAFNTLIWQKGYEVLLEEARQCPCRSRASGSPLPTCYNCRGYGWLFINPIETRALISSINKRPRYGVEWSEESIGTISASFMHIDRVAEYDRVTFINATSKRSEVLPVRTADNGSKIVFLTYKAASILDVFYLESAEKALIKASSDEYALLEDNPYIVELDFEPPADWNEMITVTYVHYPQYHAIDLPHDIRASTVITPLGQVEKVDLPVQSILRKAHLVLGVSDYDAGVSGVELADNSYL